MVSGLRTGQLQLLQISREDTLELSSIGATVRLAWISQNSSGSQFRNCSVGDLLGYADVCRVASGFAQFRKAAKNHTLIVRPDSAFVVLASLLTEPVVDCIVAVD